MRLSGRVDRLDRVLLRSLDKIAALLDSGHWEAVTLEELKRLDRHEANEAGLSSGELLQRGEIELARRSGLSVNEWREHFQREHELMQVATPEQRVRWLSGLGRSEGEVGK